MRSLNHIVKHLFIEIVMKTRCSTMFHGSAGSRTARKTDESRAENGGTITLAARFVPLAHIMRRVSREWALEATPRCFEVRASREHAKGKSHDRLLRVILSSPLSSRLRPFPCNFSAWC